MKIAKLPLLATRIGAIRFLAIAFCGLTISVGSVGCKPAEETAPATTGSGTAESNDEHADHEHAAEEPKSYGEAYDMLVKSQKMIKEAFESDSHDYAHDPLHEVGGLLNAMKKFADEDADMTAENKAAVAAAHDDLMVAFGELDAYFHDGDKVSYGDVSEKIEAGMGTLQGFVK